MNYLMKYKGVYRLLPELDKNTNDFIRDENGNIDKDMDIFISCQYGNKIFTYGHINNKKPVWLIGYIPSVGRGRNIIKALKKQNIEYIDYKESDEEVEFKFKASDVEKVAEFMKAKTSGANISPFSTKNLPKANIEIPLDKIILYKEITNVIPKKDLLFIHRITNNFLDDVLQKKSKKTDKNFSYKQDMKKLKMSRQTKEYIYTKGFWNEYLEYLKKEIKKQYE